MANTAVRHAVVEISDVHATLGGHMFNFLDTVNDYDNGCLLAKGEIDSTDYEVYAAKIPTTTDEVMLVASVPTITDARTQAEKAECYFYNKAGVIMRCYQLVKHDRYAVSSMLFDAEPTVGQYAVVGDNGTYKVADSYADEAFVAQVERIVTKGYGSAADKRVYLTVLKNA